MKRRGEEVDEGFDLVSASNHEDAPILRALCEGWESANACTGGPTQLALEMKSFHQTARRDTRNRTVNIAPHIFLSGTSNRISGLFAMLG